MKLSIAFGACAVFLCHSDGSYAQARSSGVSAVVVSDGAAVYERPDFDSKVINFLPYQTQVKISRRTYAGADGLGLFHKVRVRGKLGYDPDTDVRVGEAEREKEERKKERSGGKVEVTPDRPKSLVWDKDEDESLGKVPLYLTRFFGAAVAQVRYTEKFEGHKLSDQVLMYGLRMSGPGTLFDGPPLDVNFWFSLDKPSYYNTFSTGISGFLMFGDVMVLLPLINLDDWVVSYGLGLMWTFNKYRVQVRGENTDTVDFRIGGDMGLGIGRRLGRRMMIRADAKYYFEKNHYAGYMLSLQQEY